MASNKLSSSVVARFGTGDTKSSKAGIDLVEDSSIPSEIGITHIKAYPAKPPQFFVTSGSYRILGQKEEKASTAVAFTKNTRQALPIYGAKNVKLIQQGNAYNSAGLVTQVTFSYDALSGEVVASKEVYAVVFVEYTAPYTLIEFKFSGKGCPIEPMFKESQSIDLDGYYDAAMVVGIDPELDAQATLQLRPPQCSADKDLAVLINVNDRQLPKLVIEPHDGEGQRLDDAAKDVSSGGLLRLYPAGSSATVEASAGTISRTQFERTLSITEYVTFNGNASATLKYPPINKAGMLDTSIEMQTAAGNPITVKLATAGEEVILASFEDNGAYQIVGRRLVEADEVVPVNTFGIAVPAWGVAKVGYTTSYEIIRYTPKSAYSDARVFDDATIVAQTTDKRSATFKVDPPKIGGSLVKSGSFKR